MSSSNRISPNKKLHIEICDKMKIERRNCDCNFLYRGERVGETVKLFAIILFDFFAWKAPIYLAGGYGFRGLKQQSNDKSLIFCKRFWERPGQ